MFLYILLAILIFGLLIMIHECGHYIAARIFHVEITEFAIGMGPKVLSKKSKKTGIRYSIRLLPFGGFVSMRGELDEATEEKEPENPFAHEAIPHETVKTEQKEPPKPGDEDYVINYGNTLISRPGWQRLIVHAAGALMNITLAFILTFILTLWIRVGGTQIAEFDEPLIDENGNEITSSTVLKQNDTILSVNGHKVRISDQLYYQIMREGYKGEPLDVYVKHENGEKEHLSVTFPTVTEQGTTFGSADFKVYAVRKNFGTVVKQTFWKSTYVVQMIWESLFDVVTGRYSINAVSGPVGTAGAITEAARSGGATLLYLTLIISMNLGIFNLLPLPPLDGGHLAYTVVEMISRKRLPGKVTGAIDAAGALLFFGLLLFVTVKDILSFF
ncbi:MAG: site-2 protease family protein [Clostridia bacterium]|nr:site-2 protease family protein [Clostridia bacterium]